MAITGEQYDELENVVYNASIGGDMSVIQEIQTEEYRDSKGHVHRGQRTKKSNDPDIALALKLLDQRIGGPQDYC